MDHARVLRRAQGARRLRPGDQHVGNAAAAAWRGARQRHGLHRQQAAHGERKDARGRRSRPRHRLARRPRASAERRHAVTTMFTSAVRAIGSTLAIAVVLCAAGVALVHAQNPMLLRWDKAAPFPEPEEELYGVEAGGKMYVIGGASVMETSGEAALFGDRPARILGTNQMYDPATNTWTNRSPMSTARNHAFSGVVNGKIYVIGGRLGAAHVTASSNTDVVEEYDPARDLWGAVRSRMPTPRSGGGWGTFNGRIYVAGGEGQHERMNVSFRALEAYEPATNRWIVLPSMPTARHGAAGAFIGNRFHLVSGKPEGGGLPDLAGEGLAL